MARYPTVVMVLLLAMAAPCRMPGQQPRRVTVTTPWEDATATVAVGDRVLGSFVLGHGSGSAEFDIPSGTTIIVTVRRIGFATESQQRTVRDNDLDIQFSFGSKASPGASVTWTTTGTNADIYLDGHVIGTTRLDRQVMHGNHHFEWKTSGGGVICQTSEDILPGVTRCYNCDPAHHAVTAC